MDIVQDSMLKLVRNYKSRKSDEWPLLFHRILQNQIRDWYRRKAVRKSLLFFSQLGSAHDDSSEDVSESIPGNPGDQPASRLQYGKAMTELQNALHQLPVRQQQAFLLRVWEGLDVAQTAKAMSCSQGSVKTHYSRAVHALRKSLGDHWHDE